MIHLVTGRTKTGKTTYVRNLLFEKALKGDNKLCLIVPEQFSFYSEKEIQNLCGAKNAQNIEILSFSRLCENIFKSLSTNYQRPDKLTKLIIMSNAIESVGESLNFYKPSIYLSGEMVRLIDELSDYNVDLSNLQNEITNSTLKDKCHDIELIQKAYLMLLSKSDIDTVHPMIKASNLALENNFFDGYTVVIDAFKGFTGVEFEMISSISEQNCEVYISLCTDDIFQSEEENKLFYHINKTARRLIDDAKKNNVQIKNDIKLSESYIESDDIKSLEKNVFGNEIKVISNASEDIITYEADFINEECDYVASTIKRLIQNENYRVNEIAVLSTEIEKYQDYLSSSFKKYEIPFFEDKRVPISGHCLINLVRAILSVSKDGLSVESMLKYLKTGLCDISAEETAVLENYIFMWNIKNNKLSSDFKDSVFGFDENADIAEGEKMLFEINQTRKNAVIPLLDFSKNIKDKNALEIGSEIYKFLIREHIDKNLLKLSLFYQNNNNLNLAKEQERVWDELCTILDKLASNCGENKISVSKYLELFNLCIQNTDLGTIPVGLGEVITGDANRSRLSGIKAAFIIGASSEHFPNVSEGFGLLSSSDRKELKNMGLELSTFGEYKVAEERFVAYNALFTGSRKLYLSYSKSDYNNEIFEACETMTDIEQMFNQKRIRVLDLNPEYFVMSKASALSVYSKSRSSDTFKATLNEILSNDEDLKAKKNAIDRAKLNRADLLNFENPDISRKLFKENMYLSASKIDVFFKCPFMFFCKYGIESAPMKRATLDYTLFGTLVHAVLEEFFKEGIYKLSTEEQESFVHKFFESYLLTNLGGKEKKTKRFLGSYKRIESAALDICLMLCEDQKGSLFVPKDFEHRIKETVPLENGGTLTITGFIDRIDAFDSPDSTYIRIIDYKTGKQDFDLNLALNGLNLQMLIYLFSLKEGTPAGILYYNVEGKNSKLHRGATLKEVDEELFNSFKPKGLILSKGEIENAMSCDIKQKLSEEEFNKLNTKINELIYSMANELRIGKIGPVPYSHKDDTGCDYCEYKSVCGFKNGDYREIENLNFDNSRILLNGGELDD